MTRDIKGPLPQQYGILAKFPSQDGNQAQYSKNRSFNARMEGMMNDNKENTKNELNINFFDDADRKARNNKVKRTVDELMNQRSFLLNERRARLKQFLILEQKEFEKEIMQSSVTPLERAAQLREKAKQIRM